LPAASLGAPLGQPTRAQRFIDESLEGSRAGRDADGTVVEPRHAGLPEPDDPLYAAGGYAAPRPAGFDEQVHRAPGQRQGVRGGGPGDAGSDHRELLDCTECHTQDDTLLRFIMRS
jgi:hypothetical protein